MPSMNTSLRADVPGPPSRERRQEEVVAALDEVLPRGTILFRHEDTVPYECDALTAYRTSPMVVVLPETAAQVAAILKICHRMGVPVIARGAGTGLSGGATPHHGGVTLSLAKFNKILKIDAAACTAVVQCGVRNLAISEAAAPYGLYYAPDPSSQIACTIGGNVAENSGGVHCLKYGLTLHNLLRVRGFMVDGEPVEFGSQALDGAGLDLISIVVGSEGMLAVTTEVTVKLIPKPQLARCIMASFDDIESAGAAVASVIASGIIPAGLELMDKAMTAAVEAFVHADYDLDAAAILLCESDGTSGGSGRRDRPHGGGPHGRRCIANRGQRRRSAASEILERPQKCLSGVRRHQPGLHVHGFHHPAQAIGRDAAGHSANAGKVRPALRERLSRGRRQSASAHLV